MQLQHLSLCVPDVPAAHAFFERYFAFHCIHSQAEGSRVVLQDAGAFTLVLSPAASAFPPRYPGDFHAGFMAADVAVVGALRARMCADGVGLATAPLSFGFGTAFY